MLFIDLKDARFFTTEKHIFPIEQASISIPT